MGTEQQPIPEGGVLTGPVETEDSDGTVSYELTVPNYRKAGPAQNGPAFLLLHQLHSAYMPDPAVYVNRFSGPRCRREPALCKYCRICKPALSVPCSRREQDLSGSCCGHK